MTEPHAIVDNSIAHELVVRARVDREAFGELYDLIYPPVFKYCLRRTGKRILAEEVTSAVFLNVAEKISSFGGSTFEDFRRWVFTIATHEINADYRKATRRDGLLEEAARSGRLNSKSKPDSGIATELPVETDALQAAIRRLSEREQTIIASRYGSDLPYADIGKILGISAGACRTAASRAIEKIRSELKGQL